VAWHWFFVVVEKEIKQQLEDVTCFYIFCKYLFDQFSFTIMGIFSTGNKVYPVFIRLLNI